MRRSCIFLAGVAAISAVAACSGDGESDSTMESIEEAAAASKGKVKAGKHLFNKPLPHTNGRACATCHVASEHMALPPSNVEERFADDPSDPLFDPLDADDPSADVLTYDHLRRGLIRVTLTLPNNVDVIDADGNVITNAARSVFVWRGVPTIENTALTAPYLFDGRDTTLQAQALSALHAHSEITHNPPTSQLNHIADFEKSIFSSPGVAAVAAAIAAGKPAPDPDPHFAPGSSAAAGKALFQITCTPCHGGPAGNKIVNRAAHAQFFSELNPDGTVKLITLPDGTQVPSPLAGHENDEFLNIGVSFVRHLQELPLDQGGIPNTSGVDAPHYRLRFYTDGTRTQKVVDLPPPPFDPVTGQPLLGPNLFPQLFTVDPGRALITGDPADFEAFDVPQLRGIAGTAPYFHDNSQKDLNEVVTFYSSFVLPFVPALNLPAVVPPAGPGLPPESLTATQKAQLVAYLKKI